MKTALVTGAAGFIGRHMMRQLTAAGYSAQGIDVLYPQEDCGWVTLRDARDFFRVNTSRYDLVVHAAAVVGGRQGIDGAPLGLAVNLELDAAMFAWAARTGPGRVIYLSSSAAYPVSLQHRIRGQALREDDIKLEFPELPDALYGWVKLTGELLAHRARVQGLAVTVVRPFSGYGEDQDEDYPFAAFAGRAAGREDPFVIWGPGDQVRDWIHVDDVCGAILAAAAADVYGPVNIGTGRGVSMRELAQLMCAAAGYSPVLKTLPDKPAGVGYRVADTTAMAEFWTPRISLEHGVERALHGRM